MDLSDYCLHWHELSDSERKVIRNPEDCSVISIVDGLNVDELMKIYHSLGGVKYEFSRDYMAKQKRWIDDSKFFWGRENNRDPSRSTEYIEDFLETHTAERFRLYYFAKHPERFRSPERDPIKLFLSEVYLASQGRFGRDFPILENVS